MNTGVSFNTMNYFCVFLNIIFFFPVQGFKLVIHLILKVKKESDKDLFTAVIQFLFRIFLCHFRCPPSC